MVIQIGLPVTDLNLLNKLTSARNLLETDKITASCKTNMSPKASYETVANKQDERNLKNCLANTFSKTTIAIRFNFLKKSIHPCFL